jgi:hypothetical protein
MAEEVNENLQDVPLEKLKEMLQPEGETKPQAEEPKPETPVVETPAPSPIEGKTEESKEPLILGKFKTSDDVVKAYQELEKGTTKKAQLLSKYKEILEPYLEFDADGNVTGQKTSPPPLPTTTPKPNAQEDVLTMLESRYNTLEAQYGPVRANLIIQAEMAQAIARKESEPLVELRAERAVEQQKSKLRSKPDFAQLEPEIDAYLGRMDNNSKLNQSAVLTVYNLIKGMKFDELSKAKEDEVNLKTAEIEKQKVSAQVEHQTKTPEEPMPDINDVKLTSKELAKRAGLERIERY